MRLKQRPEDFSVKESFRFDEVPSGEHRVYLMDKQKLSTFDAIARIRDRFGLRPGSISYCGLKDKQGRTEQLIAVDGFDVDMQDEDLRLKFLGRTDQPLSAANITSNRFSVTVRAVREQELPQVNLAAAEVNRLGVVNYFDDQRFGSLKHGQGFIAKDLLRGDHEAALKNFMAVPSPLDRTDDAKVKKFWSEHWGDWSARCPFPANRKYFRILSALREKPRDFLNAFLQVDSDYRALQLFTFQSWLWNEGVRRLLQLMFPREHLFPMPYQAGTLLFHRDAAPEVLEKLRGLRFPLLSPETKFEDDQVREAALWALGKDKLTLEQLRVKGAEKLLWFKHELRPVLVYPHKLVLGKATFDELNRDQYKLNVAFTLPPGSYATLVVKRLFHFSATTDRHVPAGEEQERDDRGGFRDDRGERPERRGFRGGRDGEKRGDLRSDRGERTGRGGFRNDRNERSERGGGFRNDRGARAERGGFRNDPGERAERGGFRNDRGERSERGGGLGNDRGERSERGGGFRSERGERSERGGGFRNDRGERSERGGGFRSERGERSERGGGFRNDRGERSERGGGFRGERSDRGRESREQRGGSRDSRSDGPPSFTTAPRRGSSGFYPANPDAEAPERGNRPQRGGYRGSAPKRPGAPRGKGGNRPNFRRK